MGNLGYYARREGPECDYRERVCLTCVVDEWENGFAIDTFLIYRNMVCFEDSEWSGKRLDYGTLGYAIKRKKYMSVRDMVDGCRKELEFMGMNGERTDEPDICPGSFLFAYYEFLVDGETDEQFSVFYRIISTDNATVTYQAYHIDKYRLSSDEFIRSETLEDFFSAPDETTWYQITEEMFRMVPDRINGLAEAILNKFRNNKKKI